MPLMSTGRRCSAASCRSTGSIKVKAASTEPPRPPRALDRSQTERPRISGGAGGGGGGTQPRCFQLNRTLFFFFFVSYYSSQLLPESLSFCREAGEKIPNSSLSSPLQFTSLSSQMFNRSSDTCKCVHVIRHICCYHFEIWPKFSQQDLVFYIYVVFQVFAEILKRTYNNTVNINSLTPNKWD